MTKQLEYKDLIRAHKSATKDLEQALNKIAIIGSTYNDDNKEDISLVFFELYESLTAFIETFRMLPLIMSGFYDCNDIMTKTYEEVLPLMDKLQNDGFYTKEDDYSCDSNG